MDLSVIIVSWNARTALLDCLQSVMRETAQYVAETIVVDNASTDGSAEVVKHRFPTVKLVINDTNLGFSKANNIGMRRSSGKYLCLINSDVLVKEGCVKRMMAFMDDHPRIGVLGPRIRGADGTVQRSCMGFPTLWNTFCRALALDSIFGKTQLFGGYLMKHWPHDEIRSVDVINGCFWMVRREAVNEVGLLDERFFIYGEDIDWCRRFHAGGWDVVFYPEAEAIHYGGASSANAPVRFYLEMHRANHEYWRKYHGRFGSRAFLLLTLVHHVVRICGQLPVYFVRPGMREMSRGKLTKSAAVVSWVIDNLIAAKLAAPKATDR